MTKITNLVGQSFGRLKVLSHHSTEKGGKRYLCQCDCGRQKIIRGSSLTAGLSQSCGSHSSFSGGVENQKKAGASRKVYYFEKAKLSIGEKYGRLLIKGIFSCPKKRSNRPVCLCDCGKETVQYYADLKSGKVISCGCYRTEQASKTGSSSGVKNSRRTKWIPFIENGKTITLRSSYELIFARVLDKKGLTWQYEPQTFKLKEGCRYTPDFYVLETDEWFEVKGYITEKSVEKIRLFSEMGYKITIITLNDLERETGLKYKQMKRQWAFR